MQGFKDTCALCVPPAAARCLLRTSHLALAQPYSPLLGWHPHLYGPRACVPSLQAMARASPSSAPSRPPRHRPKRHTTRSSLPAGKAGVVIGLVALGGFPPCRTHGRAGVCVRPSLQPSTAELPGPPSVLPSPVLRPSLVPPPPAGAPLLPSHAYQPPCPHRLPAPLPPAPLRPPPCRAKRIEVSVARNEIMDQSSLIARYQQEIQLLKGQLEMVVREREWRRPRAGGAGRQLGCAG